MKRIIVTDIEWDAPPHIASKLPTEITIDVTPDKEYLLEDSEEYADAIGDYISDLTGWCHYGFSNTREEVPNAG